MKTIHFKLLLTIAAMVAVLASAGQPARGSKNDNRGNQNDKKEAVRMDKRSDYRDNVRYRGDNRPVNRELNSRVIENRPVRRESPPQKVYTHNVPVKAKVPAHFHGDRYYYYAPKYGHAVRKFHSSPIVFHARGDKFFFYNDHFYRYHKGIGYVWIENPYGMVFHKLPHGTVLVHIGGRPYYRYGNVFFAHGPYGFEVVRLPARYYLSRPVIHISASF